MSDLCQVNDIFVVKLFATIVCSLVLSVLYFLILEEIPHRSGIVIAILGFGFAIITIVVIIAISMF